MCFDVLLDSMLPTNFLFYKSECCTIVVGPETELLRVVSSETVGADLVRVEGFPPNAETAALRDTLNDWWGPELYTNSERHKVVTKLGCLEPADLNTLHSLP